MLPPSDGPVVSGQEGTGFHFPETLETVERVRRHYGLNLRLMTVARHDPELWNMDPENCCSAVKAGQLDRALAGKAPSWCATCGAWSS